MDYEKQIRNPEFKYTVLAFIKIKNTYLTQSEIRNGLHGLIEFRDSQVKCAIKSLKKLGLIKSKEHPDRKYKRCWGLSEFNF